MSIVNCSSQDAGLLDGIYTEDTLDKAIRRDVAAHILHNTLFATLVQYNQQFIPMRAEKVTVGYGSNSTLAQQYYGLSILVGVALRNSWAGFEAPALNTGMKSSFRIREIDGRADWSALTPSESIDRVVQFPDDIPLEMLGHEVQIYARQIVAPTTTTMGGYDKIYGTIKRTARSVDTTKFAQANIVSSDWAGTANTTLGYYVVNGDFGLGDDDLSSVAEIRSAQNGASTGVFGNYIAGISATNTILAGSPITFIDNDGDGNYEYINARSYWYSKISIVGTDADVKITAASGDGDSFDGVRVLNGTNSADIYNGADLKVDDRVLVYKIDGKFGIHHVPVTNGTLTAAKDNSNIAVISTKEYKQPQLASRVVALNDILTTSGNYNVEKDYRVWEGFMLEGPVTSAPGKKWALILDSFIQGTGIATNTKSVKLLLEDGTQGTYALGSIYKGTSTGSTYTLDAAPTAATPFPDPVNSTPASNRIYVTGAAGDPLNTVILTPEAGAIALADISADGKSVNLYDGESAADGTASYTSDIGNNTQDWEKDDTQITFDNSIADFTPSTKVGSVGTAATNTLINNAQVLDSSIMFAVRLWDSGDSDKDAQDAAGAANGRFRSASVFKGRGMSDFLDSSVTTDDNIRYKVIQNISQKVGTGVVATSSIQPIVAASFVGSRVQTLGNVIGNYAYVIDHPEVNYVDGAWVATIPMFDGTTVKPYTVMPGIRSDDASATWNRGDIDSATDNLLGTYNLNVIKGDIIEYATNADGKITSMVTIHRYDGNNDAPGGLRNLSFAAVAAGTSVSPAIAGLSEDNGHAYVGYMASKNTNLIKMYPAGPADADKVALNPDVSYWFDVDSSVKVYEIDTAAMTGVARTIGTIPEGSENTAYRAIAVTAGLGDTVGANRPKIVALFYIVGDQIHPINIRGTTPVDTAPSSYIHGSGGRYIYATGSTNGIKLYGYTADVLNQPSTTASSFVPLGGLNLSLTPIQVTGSGWQAGGEFYLYYLENGEYKWTLVRDIGGASGSAAVADAMSDSKLALNAAPGSKVISTGMENIGVPGATINMEISTPDAGDPVDGGTGGMAPGVENDFTDGGPVYPEDVAWTGFGINLKVLFDAYGIVDNDDLYFWQKNPVFETPVFSGDARINGTTGIKLNTVTDVVITNWELASIPAMKSDEPIILAVYSQAGTTFNADNTVLTGTPLFTITIDTSDLEVLTQAQVAVNTAAATAPSFGGTTPAPGGSETRAVGTLVIEADNARTITFTAPTATGGASTITGLTDRTGLEVTHPSGEAVITIRATPAVADATSFQVTYSGTNATSVTVTYTIKIIDTSP